MGPIVIYEISFEIGVPSDRNASALDIDFVEAIATDIKALPDATEVRVDKEYFDRFLGLSGASGQFWKELIAVSVPPVCATGAYLGKKALDVLSDIIKAKLTSLSLDQSRHIRTIEIYGPDGKVVRGVSLPPK